MAKSSFWERRDGAILPLGAEAPQRHRHMNVAVLVQQLINGSRGLHLQLGRPVHLHLNAVGIVNLAQGDFVTMAAFLYAATLSNKLGFGFGLSLLGVAAFMSVFGMGAERVVYSPLKDAHPRAVMLSTMALGIFLSNLYIIVWGPYPVTTAGPFGQGVIHFGEVSILKQNLFVIVITGYCSSCSGSFSAGPPWQDQMGRSPGQGSGYVDGH